MNKEVVIIGGGIIGLCSAYFLLKDGHKVTVIDKSEMNLGASYINAGLFTPSHIIPLAAPGMIKKGLKWMFNPSSPLYIKPRLDIDFLKWSWAFNKVCTSKHVNDSIPAIKNITELSQKLYDEITLNEGFKFHHDKKGLLMLCNSEKGFDSEVKIAEIARKAGLKVEVLNKKEVQKLEPKISLNIFGAINYINDSHCTPTEFMEEMKAFLLKLGVVIYKNEEVIDIKIKNSTVVEVRTKTQTLKADEFVLAAGTWTSKFLKKIGVDLLLQAGKGYCINSLKSTNIKMPAILVESNAAVTPMNGFTRFAGTMEIAGFNTVINKARVEAIANSVKKYYPTIEITKEEKQKASYGFRPLSSDGLPYIGKFKKFNNLTIATGHAMLGWTMGTGTGKLVSEIVSNTKPSLNLEPFNVSRKF